MSKDILAEHPSLLLETAGYTSLPIYNYFFKNTDEETGI